MKSTHAAEVVLPVLLLMPVSCNNNDENLSVSPPGLPNVIVPLQVGNTWIFRRISYDTLGAAGVPDTVVQRVERDTMIQAERWFISETTSGQSAGTLRSDGYWTYIEGVPALTFLYPASVHDTYPLSDTGPTMRILAVDTLIAVPFGTYPCIAYEQLSIQDGRRIRIDYYAANTGPIRIEEYIRVSSGGDSVARKSDLIASHAVR